MGHIIVKTPFDLEMTYFLENKKTTKELIKNLEKIALRVNKDSDKTSSIEMPKTTRQKGLEAAFGIWADRKESGKEIAMKIRKANRQAT
ncbi:MAG: hypothetical protein ACR2GD_01485 [Pyrinomonadaceae bacterium]